ncbi:unnamed protein product [Vitrella brassicaformis CCMP3155]|uniref:Autophagy-related protein 27 n=2 Tax=Vitrella brassicaformis TaxID=1169539 RepID=A0A0G4ES95_VITBC|nr:unnamed protein product [Vitrella brassicaformis CCMP3155]|eukprot:CEM00735.1 unnamed protein product [Vitrella brassicaformis CCMP3155]
MKALLGLTLVAIASVASLANEAGDLSSWHTSEHHHDSQQPHYLQHGIPEHEAYLKKLEAPAVRNGKHPCIVEWSSPFNHYTWNLCGVERAGEFERCMAGNATETFCYRFAVFRDLNEACDGMATPAMESKTNTAGFHGCRLLGHVGHMDLRPIDHYMATRGLELTYFDGDPYQHTSEHHRVSIHFKCDPSRPEGLFDAVDGRGSAHYTFELRGPAGCPLIFLPGHQLTDADYQTILSYQPTTQQPFYYAYNVNQHPHGPHHPHHPHTMPQHHHIERRLEEGHHAHHEGSPHMAVAHLEGDQHAHHQHQPHHGHHPNLHMVHGVAPGEESYIATGESHHPYHHHHAMHPSHGYFRHHGEHHGHHSHHHVTPHSGRRRLGPATFLLICVLVAAALYVSIGIYLKQERHNARGIDMIPNVAFWLEFPSLVRDGVLYMSQGVSDRLWMARMWLFDEDLEEKARLANKYNETSRANAQRSNPERDTFNYYVPSTQ